MNYRVIAASAFLTLAYLPASAASADYVGSGWSDLFDLCGGTDCTVGVAEMRAGDYNAGYPEAEMTVGTTTDVPGTFAIGGKAWPDNQAVGFTIVGTSTSLSLTVDGGTPSPLTYGMDLSSANGIVLRGAGYNGGAVSISDLIINSMNLGDFTFSGGAKFYHLTGFDATDFTATGSILFDYDTPIPNNQKRSNLAVQFKLVDTPAPVPLPAAGWLLGAGVAALVGYGRRKKSA